MIENPFQINDWPTKKALAVLITIQLIVLILAGLKYLDINIPILSSIAGFFYLCFVPGIILLRILKLHNLGSVKTLLYTIGLSLTFDMLLGLLTNSIFPLLGVARPLSTVVLVLVWLVVLGGLCTLAYTRDRRYAAPSYLEIKKLLSPPVLILILLPLLAVLGTQISNIYSSNVILMLLITLIGIIVLVIMFSDFIPDRLHPFAVFCIALALIWHFSLTSVNLIGYDVFDEYYFYQLVNLSEIWNPTVPFPHMYNEMLSITILPTVFSHILAIDGEQIFKIIYPLWYALVPLALFGIYNKYFNSKYSFLAVFFFMSMYTFFLEIPSANREILGELFIALLVTLIIDKKDNVGNRVLIIIFSLGLVVSHYSLSFLYLGFLILSLLILLITRAKSVRITAYSVALFAVLCLAWYIYISGYQSFKSIVYIGFDTLQNFSIEFMNPFSRDVSLYVMQTSPTVLHLVARVLNYLMLFLLAIGAIGLLLSIRKNDKPEYTALSICSYVLLGAAIVVPFLSDRLGAERILHIAAMLIAPFCISGMAAIFTFFPRIFHRKVSYDFRMLPGLVLAPILVILFWLNTGFLFELVHDPWLHSPALSINALDDPQRTVIDKRKVALRYLAPTQQEISSAKWLSSHMGENQPIYATFSDIRVPSLAAYGLITKERTTPIDTSNIDSIKNGYIYLGYVNNLFKLGSTNPYYVMGSKTERVLQVWDIDVLSPVLNNANKVFDNSASTIYHLPK